MGVLEQRLGLQEAEVVAGFSAIAGPLLAASLIVLGLYKYLRYELSEQFGPGPSLPPLDEMRQLIAQNEATAALREHTEELARQRKTVPDVIENFKEAINRKNRVAMGLERDPNALKIVVGSGSEFEEVHPRPNHVARTVLACAENTDKNHFISNCKVSVEVSGGGTYQLVDSFTLNPTEKRFFPIATHHEADVDKFIHIAVPRVGGFFAEAYNVRLPLTGGMITIKATSAETRPAQQICHLFVDDSGRLQMEKA